MISKSLPGDLSTLAGNLRKGGEAAELLPLLRQEGLFQLLQSARWGGQETSWFEFVSTTRELASVCPAAGWLLATCGINAVLVGRMPAATQARVWSREATQVIAGAGNAVESDVAASKGGCVVNGHWENVLAAASSDWVLASTVLDETPCVVLLPSADLEVSEVSGGEALRGSGCASVRAHGIRVDRDSVIAIADLFAGKPRSIPENRLYSCDFALLYHAARLGAVVGAAQGAYREYVNITSKWISGIGGHQVAKFTQVQVRLAETNADLTVAGLLLDQSSAGLQHYIDKGELPDDLNRAELRRNNAYAARKALACTGRLVVQMGARGLMASNPVQHFFVDVRAMAAHQSMEWAENMSFMGKTLLGQDTESESLPDSLFVGG